MKNFLSAILFLIIFGITIYLFFGLKKINEETIYSGPIEKIKIAAYKGERSSLIYIADEMGFFLDNGIEVEIIENDSGVKSVKAVRDNEVDIGTAAEYPFVVDVLAEASDLKIIGVIDFVKAYEIIANKNSGISSVDDLRGKRIGLKKGSQAEFLFGVFLTSNNIKEEEVDIIDLDQSQMKEKLLSNEIDATVVCDPFTAESKLALENNYLIWNAQPNRRFYFLSICREEFIDKNPELIKRFLDSLIRAEIFIENNQAVSQNIIQKRIGVDLEYLKKVWEKNNFNVTLEQSLILTLEDESRWKMEKSRISQKEPNYLDYIYINGLSEVDNKRITIIR